MTLRNSGPDTLVLVSPGDVWRTPIVKWAVRDRQGRGLPPWAAGYCGNRSPLTGRDIFVLGPGEERNFTRGFPLDTFSSIEANIGSGSRTKTGPIYWVALPLARMIAKR